MTLITKPQPIRFLSDEARISWLLFTGPTRPLLLVRHPRLCPGFQVLTEEAYVLLHEATGLPGDAVAVDAGTAATYSSTFLVQEDIAELIGQTAQI